jgi:acylphosphatase
MSEVRSEVVYTGRVQGVGFRATARSIALDFEVSGWVRNEPDGTVRLIAEGEHAEVGGFLAAIQQHFGAHITSAERRSGAATGEFAGFQIRR